MELAILRPIANYTQTSYCKSVIWQILISFAAWLILMFLSTNLLGFLARNTVSKLIISEESAAGDNSNAEAAEQSLNPFALVLLLLFLSALFYFGNYALVFAVLMLMAGRLPDLVWEVRQGRKLHLGDMKRTAFPVLSALLVWASLPVIWFGLYWL